MRAIVCSAPDADLRNTTLALSEIPRPGPGQVRVAMRAASLNPVDWKLATGVAPWWEGVGPRIVGLDGAGVVDALGEGVTGVAVGDRVAWHGDLNRNGVLADFALADAHVLAPIPEGVDFRHAAALPCAGMTAFQALTRKARVEPGQVILVQGAAGAVGGFAVQLARDAGATVLALARPEQADRVRALGADEVLGRDDPDLREQVRRRTGGYGADVMMEVANPGDARRSLELVRYNGHLLCVDPLPNLERVQPYTYAASIHEVALGGAYAAGHRPTQEDFRVMLGELLDRVRQGRLDPMIERTIALEDVPGALAAMRDASPGGKIVVDIDSGEAA